MVLMGVSKNNGKTPQIIHFNRFFHYKPSILGNQLYQLGGGFKYVLFSPPLGEMIKFDEYFSNGLKPPASRGLYALLIIRIPCH